MTEPKLDLKPLTADDKFVEALCKLEEEIFEIPTELSARTIFCIGVHLAIRAHVSPDNIREVMREICESLEKEMN